MSSVVEFVKAQMKYHEVYNYSSVIDFVDALVRDFANSIMCIAHGSFVRGHVNEL